jgi:hypothetical protein
VLAAAETASVVKGGTSTDRFYTSSLAYNEFEQCFAYIKMQRSFIWNGEIGVAAS